MKKLKSAFTMIIIALFAVVLTVGCINGPAVEDTIEMPDRAVNLNDQNFDSSVARAGVVALIEFYQPGCGTCRSMMWVIDSVAFSIGDSAVVGAVNIDSCPALAARFSISSIPSYLLFLGGEVVARRTYGRLDSTAFDTLAMLTRACIAGTLDPDTGSIDTTGQKGDSSIVELDRSNFDFLTSGTDVLAIVEFYSPICAGCQAMAPAYDSIGVRFGDSLLVGRVNVVENDTLMKKYAVATVPAFAFFSGGTLLTLKNIDSGPEAFDSIAVLVRALLDGTLVADTADIVDTVDREYLTLNDTTFDSTVLRQGTVAMVFFLYAEGAPCIYMDSVVARLVPYYKNRAVVAKLHAWDQYNTSLVAQRYGITNVPRFLFFKDSLLVEQRAGICSGDTLAAVLNRLLGDTIPAGAVQLDKNSFYRMVHVPGRVAMVDFFSPTCHACMSMDSIVAALADSFPGTALIGKVDVTVDDSLDVAYAIQWVPTFVFFKNGVEYERITGVYPRDTLAACIRRGLDGSIAKRRGTHRLVE